MLRQRVLRWLALALLLPLLLLQLSLGKAPAQPKTARPYDSERYGREDSGRSPIPLPILSIEGLGKGIAKLDGPWQFHTGDDPAWASQALDDSNWQTISADQPWGVQTGYSNFTGLAWYRRHITITPATGIDPTFALLIEHIDDAYQVYWNGTLIGQNGKLPPHPAWYNQQAAQTYGLPYVLDPVLMPGTANVLAIRVWKAPYVSYDDGRQGGFQSAPLIGSPEEIAASKASLDYDWLRSRQFVFAIDSLYALVALLSLITWLRNRKAWVLFWMGGFSLAPLLILFLDGLRLKIPFDIALGLQQPIYSLEDISLWAMLLWFLNLEANRRLRRVTWILAIVNLSVTSLDGLMTALFWGSAWGKPYQLADGIMSAVDTCTEVWPLLIIALAVVLFVRQRRRLDPARWLVAISAFLSVSTSVLQVTLAQGRRFTHWDLSERLFSPLLSVNGISINPYNVFRTFLILSLIYAVYRYYAETGRRRNTLEQELQSVRELQQVLIPETPPSVPGFTLTGAYRPAQEVGGDFFQIIPIESTEGQSPSRGSFPKGAGSTLIVLGDVSGKGLKAAMAVAVILGAIRALAPFFTDPALLLGELNQSLQGRLQGAFATCIILRVDHKGHCLIATAGHPSPFLNDQELALPGALPLALSSLASYEDTAIDLKVDDRLALYTDGLLEARNPAGELFSFDRLQQLFRTNPTAEQATEAAVQFGQDDDITVLTLTRRPSNYREPRSLSETQTITLYPVS